MSTAQTASAPRAKLLEGGLLAVEVQGRHRYYRLAGPEVALTLESLASLGATEPVRRKPPSRDAQALRLARCSVDHLAGRLGVAVTRALEVHGYLVPAECRRSHVTPAGTAWFGGLLALTMAVAFLAEVLVVPAVITLFPRIFGAPTVARLGSRA